MDKAGMVIVILIVIFMIIVTLLVATNIQRNKINHIRETGISLGYAEYDPTEGFWTFKSQARVCEE